MFHRGGRGAGSAGPRPGRGWRPRPGRGRRPGGGGGGGVGGGGRGGGGGPDLLGERGQQGPVQRLAAQLIAQLIGVRGRDGVVARLGRREVLLRHGVSVTCSPRVSRAAAAGDAPSIRTPDTARMPISTAAQVIAASATLNVHGKCGRFSQSTTLPRSGPGARNSRSPRLPAAPPSSSPRPMVQDRLRSRAAIRMT